MAEEPYLKNIAVVGAGNLGSLVIQRLIATKRFNITIISRSGSSSKFPTDPSVTVKQGDYGSPSFLSSAFAGQEAVILTLHHSAIPDLEISLIEAAAAADVKWILPVEYGNDNANEDLVKLVPFNGKKTGPRIRIEELAKGHEGLKWIGVITNPWFDMSLKMGMFQIDSKKKTVNLLGGGTTKFNTTNLATVALAVARLMSLPVISKSGASLSNYGNRFVYIRSFHTSQREILSAVQRVTNTSDADWEITHTEVQTFIDEGTAKMAKGDYMGMVNVLYGYIMKEGAGGDYESVRGVSNKVLGLPEEDLDESVENVLNEQLNLG